MPYCHTAVSLPEAACFSN